MNCLSGKTSTNYRVCPEPKPEVVSACQGPVTEWTWDSAAPENKTQHQHWSVKALYLSPHQRCLYHPQAVCAGPAEITELDGAVLPSKDWGTRRAHISVSPAAKVGAVWVRGCGP